MSRIKSSYLVHSFVILILLGASLPVCAQKKVYTPSQGYVVKSITEDNLPLREEYEKLMFRTANDCSIKINGVLKGKIKAGEMLVVYLPLGGYDLELTALNHPDYPVLRDKVYVWILGYDWFYDVDTRNKWGHP